MDQVDFHAVLRFLEGHKELLTIVVAAVGGGLALWRYWRDQAWQKKQFAYDYAESVFSDPRTMTALRMLDWSTGTIPDAVADEYNLKSGDRDWTADEVGEALRLHDKTGAQSSERKRESSRGRRQGRGKGGQFSDKEYAIRELFDDCLARFERLGHFMMSGVISKKDFPTTLAYYPEIMREPRLEPIRDPLRCYMERYGFDYALYVFDSFYSEERPMQREDMLERVRAAYDARRSGDFDTLRELVAEDAGWTLHGEETLLAGFPGTGGVGVHQAAKQLFDTIELRELERVDSLAEGNRVAILWKTTAAIPGSEPFETMMFDLWEFNDAGKICKGMQFVDTAKFVEAMRARAEA